MHGMFAICFTLLTIIAGMLLLAKTQKEELGRFFKVVSYIVIVVGFLCLMCCLTRCICRMACGRNMSMTNEYCRMMPCCGGMLPKACCGKMMSKECNEEKEDDDDKAKGAAQGTEDHPVTPPPAK